MKRNIKYDALVVFHICWMVPVVVILCIGVAVGRLSTAALRYLDKKLKPRE
jgi:hypothetical protein